MIEQFLEMLNSVEKSDEFFKVSASIAKKSFDAYVKAGFTEDQAMQIIVHQGLGLNKS